METEARAPDSESDWQAIDIFVFSNGQQYSPPRKYHLQGEDINLWKSTLNFLSKTQYGPYHSTIDLYTTEGRKIAGPLQLSNGGSYVAVQPPDSFIEAGYDKYLIKASRSWEKRKAKRNESIVEADNPKNISNAGNVEDNIDNLHYKSMEENVIFKSRVSSIANHDASTIIKPQLLPAPTRKLDSLLPAKQTERKKTSIQSPLVARKITPSSLPIDIKNSISKKKDNIKSTFKITKPEVHKNSSCTSGHVGASAASKLSPRLNKAIRPPTKSRDSSIRSEAIQMKVQEANKGSEIKSPSRTKAIKNDEKLSTNSADLNNVIEDKDLIMVSNLYKIPSIVVNPTPHNLYKDSTAISVDPARQNQYSEIPTIFINTIPKQSILCEPAGEQETKIIVENPDCKSEGTVPCINSGININTAENNENSTSEEGTIRIKHNVINNTREKFSAEKLQIEQYSNYNDIHIVEEKINLFNDKVKVNDVKVHSNVKTQDSPPRTHSIRVEMADNQMKANNITYKLEGGLNIEAKVSTCRSSETIKVFNSSPQRSSTITDRVFSQCIDHKIKESGDVPPTVIDKLLSDQYKATIKKGDVVNLKLSIEIENHDGNIIKHRENLNCNSVTIIRTDKGSQSNIDDQIIAQNKSLLSFITKEFQNHHVGDNHHVIMVQYNCCNYCNGYKAANLDRELDKNYVILLPIEKCQCNETKPEIHVSSLINPVKPTFSCTSLPRITNPLDLPADAASQNIHTPETKETKCIDNVVTVSRKKSVAINEESTINTCAPSKIIQENVKTELITFSVESMRLEQNIAVENISTQTEWCDVLLEAKLLSDGHYSFSFPPLELLKHYKLT